MTNQKPNDQTLNGETSKEKPTGSPSPNTKEENKMPLQEAAADKATPIIETPPPAASPPPVPTQTSEPKPASPVPASAPPPTPAATPPAAPPSAPPAADEKPGEVAKVTLMHIPGRVSPVPPAPPATPAETPADKPETPVKAQEATTAPDSKPAEAPPEVKAEASDTVPPARTVTQIDPGQAHVLVVEDNVPNFVLIARMLAYMGVQRCEWKTSGWQVVEFADTLPRIDLILMDIRLPYEDGFQALEKVRSNARLKDTLVVAVTAEASVDQMKRAQTAGFDGFLSKPLDPDRFPDQIRRVLSGEAVWEIH
jgi:two-component system cell cycle response regulator DivK